MYNRAIIIGRLTKDPELKQTTSGVSVCSFSVAVDRKYNREEVDFLECVAWQKTAEFLWRYFHKGSPIGIEGSIQTRKYEDRNGSQRTAVEIVADNVFFVGAKEKPTADVEYTAPASEYEEFDPADDLPFDY